MEGSMELIKSCGPVRLYRSSTAGEYEVELYGMRRVYHSGYTANAEYERIRADLKAYTIEVNRRSARMEA